MEKSKPASKEVDYSEWQSESDEDPWANSDDNSDSDYNEFDNDRKLKDQRLKSNQKLGLDTKIDYDTESQTSAGEDQNSSDGLSDCEDLTDVENFSDCDNFTDCDSNSDFESDDLEDLDDATENCYSNVVQKQFTDRIVEKTALSPGEKLIAARLQLAEKISKTKAADLVYTRGVSKVKWNEIHIDGFTTEELKKMLKDIMVVVSPTRVLEEVLSAYLTNPPRYERNAHPDFPKIPINPFNRYMKCHAERVEKLLTDSLGRRPKLSEVNAFCLKAYGSLPDTDRERLKHVGEYNRESEIYKERLRIFYEEHEALRVQTIPKPDFYKKVTPKLWFREQMCYELLRFIPLEESNEMWEKLSKDEKKKYITGAYQLETTKPKLINDEEWKIMVDFPERPPFHLIAYFRADCRHLYTGDERFFSELSRKAFISLQEEELHLLRKEHFEKVKTWLRDLELWIRRQPEDTHEELASLFDLKCENRNKSVPRILKKYQKIFIEKKTPKPPRVYVQKTLPKDYDPFRRRVVKESEESEDEEEEEVKPKKKLKIERLTKSFKIKIGRPGKAKNATKLKKDQKSSKEKIKIKTEKLKQAAEAKAKALKIKEKEKLRKEKEKARQEMEVLEEPSLPVFVLNREEYLPEYGWDKVPWESHLRTSPIKTRPLKRRPEITQLIPKRLKIDEPPIPALTTPYYFVLSRVCVNPIPKEVKKAYTRMNILDKLVLRDKMIRQRNEFQKAAKSYTEQVDEEKAAAFVAKVKEERAKQKVLTYWHDDNGTDYENDSDNEIEKWINEPEPNAPQLSIFCGQPEEKLCPAADDNLNPEANTPQPFAEMINEPEPNAPQLSDFCGQPGRKSIKVETTAKVRNRSPSAPESTNDTESNNSEDSDSSICSTD